MKAKHMVVVMAGLALVALPAAAIAHGSMRPSHGGIVTMTGETVIELVRERNGVDIYISEEDEPLAASGFTGKLTVTAGGAKKEAALVAQAGNKMTAPGLRIPAGARVVVSLTTRASGVRTLASFTVR